MEDIKTLNHAISSLRRLETWLNKLRNNAVSQISPIDRTDLQRTNLVRMVESRLAATPKDKVEALSRDLRDAYIEGASLTEMKAAWHNFRGASLEEILLLARTINPDFPLYSSRKKAREELRKLLGIVIPRNKRGWSWRQEFGEYQDYQGFYADKRLACMAAVQKTRNDLPFWVARLELRKIEEFAPTAEELFVLLRSHARESAGRGSEVWLADLRSGAIFDLKRRVDTTLKAWAKKWGLDPRFYVVIDEEMVEGEEFRKGFFRDDDPGSETTGSNDKRGDVLGRILDETEDLL